ncbi:MAG: CoA transferase [Acidimicrobiales bacterium]|nr:CoA transferase [Acidimicrobiales bacterium]MBD53345.1 CoA transferase [Acidimicrobiaceae bacterium]RPH18132.1 MAG: CoA transferase [Actinobacteria bacterium TMED270]HCJ85692.1 CoA transferase [Acidimicrobiaceae bacterium]
MTAPLSGIRIIDFTRVLAGPHCTKALRDLGAEVIKIEPPDPDTGRSGQPHVGPMSLYFAQQNAGKRAISIDLNFPEAQQIVKDLVETADIVVENFRPGTLDLFGLGFEDLSTIKPNLIMVSISGYGQTGPWRNRPAFAPTVQAEAGFTEIIGRHYGDALTRTENDAYNHADVYTGLQGVIATLAALAHRNQTGEGQHVDVAMVSSLLSVNDRVSYELSDIDVEGEPLALSAPESPVIELPDGRKITIAASPVSTFVFQRYCAMMRRNDLLLDPRFINAQFRRDNWEDLLAEIRSWVLTFRTIEELEAQVSEAGLAVGTIRSVSEIAESEWAVERGAIREVEDRSGGTARVPAPPWIFSNCELPDAGLPPFQGEHNTELLRSLGLSEVEIEKLEATGVLISGVPNDT